MGGSDQSAPMGADQAGLVGFGATGSWPARGRGQRLAIPLIEAVGDNQGQGQLGEGAMRSYLAFICIDSLGK